MSQKDEVLHQIKEIKSHLVDKETFFPYNYNACHVWAIIAVVLTLVMLPAYEHSIGVGTGVMSLLILVGFVIEGMLIKRENASYDIDDCTKKQEFIMKNFLMISLFLILLSTTLATYGLYVVIYILWLFFISLGHFSVGFVLNIKDFTQMAQFNMSMAFMLLMVGGYFNLLDEPSWFIHLTQAVVIFGLGVLPSLIAIRQQKREVCSV